MFFIHCGIAYAGDYDVNSNKDVIEISELAGHCYVVFAAPIPLIHRIYYSFDESGNFLIDQYI